MNHTSSRSHCVFQINIEITSLEKNFKICSAINLIDLAGSEGVAKSDIGGDRLKEGSSINKSLLAMYNVIHKLNKKESFICFRESKLTRILQNYLGGNSITAIICTINPLMSNYQESLNTLRFALCAGDIRNDIKVNIKDTTKFAEIDDMQAELANLTMQRDELTTTIENQRRELEEKSKLIVETTERLEGSIQQMQLDSCHKDEMCLSIEKANEVLEDLQKQKNRLEEEVGLLRSRLDTLLADNTLNMIQEELMKVSERQCVLENSIEENTRKEEECNEQINAATVEIDCKETTISKLKKKQQFLEKSATALKNVLNSQKRCRNMRQNREFERVKELLKCEMDKLILIAKNETINNELFELHQKQSIDKIAILDYKYRMSQETKNNPVVVEDETPNSPTGTELSFSHREPEPSIKSLNPHGLGRNNDLEFDTMSLASFKRDIRENLCFSKPRNLARIPVEEPKEPTEIVELTAFEQELFNSAKSSAKRPKLPASNKENLFREPGRDSCLRVMAQPAKQTPKDSVFKQTPKDSCFKLNPKDSCFKGSLGKRTPLGDGSFLPGNKSNLYVI
jgi:hypothetical protein